MPTYIKRLTPDGISDVNYSADNLKAATDNEPKDGIYTVTNTYNITQTLMLDAHLDRLEDSARREQIALDYDRPTLKASLRQMILDANFGDVKFRITVGRSRPNELILTLEPFIPPAPELITQGTRCITSSMGARHNPAAKTTDWIHDRKALEQSRPADIYDTFLLSSEGLILEGLASNFYAILNSELRTAGEGVLAGISRRIIFEICEGILPLNAQAVHVDDIPQLEEAFLTSSSRGVIPVIEIDGISIGEGKVGEKTKQLRQAYQALVNKHLREL